MSHVQRGGGAGDNKDSRPTLEVPEADEDQGGASKTDTTCSPPGFENRHSTPLAARYSTSACAPRPHTSPDTCVTRYSTSTCELVPSLHVNTGDGSSSKRFAPPVRAK
jgi:hypothetical protein